MIIRWLAFIAAIVLFFTIAIMMLIDIKKDMRRSETKKQKSNTRKNGNVIYLSKK